MLTIAQITDLHIASERDVANHARNLARLKAVLDAIHEVRPKPSAIIATGDLSDRGEPEEYALLKSVLARSEIPFHLALGNHDRRKAFTRAFPETGVDQAGFVQYTTRVGELLIVVCDTLDEGRNGGAFCERRASWLRQTLRPNRKTPTILALHHPPVLSGIRWMDPDPGEPWIPRLAGLIEGHRQIQAIICGHIHRAFHARFAGHIVSVSPASAPQLTLDLSPIDFRRPDARQLVVEEPPGFTLLAWDDGKLTTHRCIVGNYPSVLDYKVPFDKGFA